MDFLQNINLDIKEVLLYFDIGIITTLLFAFLFGLWRGWMKSIYYFSMFLLTILIGLFLAPNVSKLLLDVNLSALPFVDITSLREFAREKIINIEPNIEPLLVSGTTTFALFNGILEFIAKLIFFVVLFILHTTLFALFRWIIWMIIRPRKIDKTNGARRKKTWSSRLIGAGIGVVHNILTLILLGSLMFGALSLTDSADKLMKSLDDVSQEEQLYTIVIQNNQALLVDHRLPLAEKPKTEYLEQYQNSLLGKITGLIKFKKIPLDQLIFDEIFSIHVEVEKDNKVKLNLRHEIEIVSNVLAKISEINGGNLDISPEIIAKLKPEDGRNIFGELTQLSMIKVLMPVAIEYVYSTDVFNKLPEELRNPEVVDEFKKIDFLNELKIFGEIFVDAISLLGSNTSKLNEINFMAFESEEVLRIFKNLGDLMMLQLAFPVALGYYSNQSLVKTFLEQYGIDSDSITYPSTKEELKAEIQQIGILYKAFKGLGIESVAQLKQIQKDTEFFQNLSDDAIHNFIDKLFEFKMINSNIQLASGIIHKTIQAIVPDGFKDAIPLDSIKNNLSATEITNILKFGKFVLSTGVLNAGDDKINFSKLLTDENIDKFINHLYESKMATENMNSIFSGLIHTLNMDFEIVIPDDFDFGSVEGKTDLKEMLKTTQIIFESGILSEQQNLNLDKLSDEMILKLSTSMSSSKIIKSNLSSIIQQFITKSLNEFTVVLLEDSEEWTKEELSHIFHAAKLLVGKENAMSELFKVSDEQIDHFIKSKVLSQSIVFNMKEMTKAAVVNDGVIEKEAGVLHDLLIIDGVKNDQDWYDKDATPGELRKLLKAFKLIIKDDFDVKQIENFDINVIMKLSNNIDNPNPDDDVKKLISSVVLKDTVIHQIIKYSKDETSNIVVTLEKDSPVWVDQYNSAGDVLTEVGEIRRLLKAFNLILKDETDVKNIKIDLDTVTGLDPKNYQLISSSYIISDTAAKIIKEQAAEKNIFSVPEDVIWRSTKTFIGELESLLLAFKILLKDNKKIEDINLSSITDFYVYDDVINLPDTKNEEKEENRLTLLNSKIISETIISKIKEEAAKPESIIMIPTDIVWSGSDGELTRMIDAMNILLPSGDITTFKVQLDSIYTKKFVDELGYIDIDGGYWRQTKVLQSGVIFESIKKKIIVMSEEDNAQIVVNQHLIVWENELTNLIDALGILLPDGKIDNVQIDITDIFIFDGSGDEKLGGRYRQNTVLSSRIIRDSMIKVIRDETNKPESMIKMRDPNHEPEWQDNGEEAGELRNIIGALNQVLGDKKLENANLTISEILNKDFNTILKSEIIEHSIVLKAKELLISDALVNLFEAQYVSPVRDYDWYKGENPVNLIGDLQPLLEVLRDLGNRFDIDYENIHFEVLVDKLKVADDEEESDKRAKDLSDLLLTSNIFENSLDKMFAKVLGDAGFHDIIINNPREETYWRGTEFKLGELVLLLQGMGDNVSTLQEKFEVINDETSNDIRKALKKMNRSHILRQVLSEIISEGLDNVSEWKYSDVNPKVTFSESDWNHEIDALVDLVVLLNKPDSLNLNTVEIDQLSNDQIDELALMLKPIARSRILDINKIAGKMVDGISTVLTITVTANHGEVSNYHPNNDPNDEFFDTYERKVEKWNDEVDGEILKLVVVMKKLHDLKEADPFLFPFLLPEFIDALDDSVLLSPIADEIRSQLLG